MKIYLTLTALFSMFWWVNAKAGTLPSGYYNNGSLSNSISLFDEIKNSKGTIVSLSPKQFQYGSAEMRDALKQISDWVKTKEKGPLRVGDISKKKGGKIARHVGHQNGLGADIAYITKNEPAKKGHRSESFHNRFPEVFEDDKGLSGNFEVQANYELIHFIHNHFSVFNVLVGCKVFKALKKIDEERKGGIVKVLRGKPGHEDHFHLRLKCPEYAKGCKSQWWDNPKRKGKKKYPRCP